MSSAETLGHGRPRLARLGLILWAWLVAACAGPALAQDDPPGRVGRLADLQGQSWWYEEQTGQWTEADRNRPLTQGDRISTAPDARAELRVGSTVLRLGGVTELQVLRLDDERMAFQLHTGRVALRVQSREVAGGVEIVTGEAVLRPQHSGHYRVDRIDDTTHAGSWRGSLRVAGSEGLVIGTGQRAELWREGSGRALRHAWAPLPDDAFALWVASEDQRDQRSAATRHVSPEMTGAEDLDRHGRWDRHPEYGAVWFPTVVRAGWAPYRYGRWVWVRPWGWTWVDEAPWGFAPFHYGRWVHWGGRWGWWPGAYVARPVFAPALVAWVGGSNWGVSVDMGGPAVGWVPLAPREAYAPWYRVTPIYVDRVNHRPPHRPGRRPVPHVPHVPTGPVMYGNQGVPGAVTVVPRDALLQRQPVGRAVIEPRGAGKPGDAWVRKSPPPGPAAVATVEVPRPRPGQRPPPTGRDRRDAAELRDARPTESATETKFGRPEGAGPWPLPAQRGGSLPPAGRSQSTLPPQPGAQPAPRLGPSRPGQVVTTAPQQAQPGPAAPRAPATAGPRAPAAQPKVPAAPVPAARPAARPAAGPDSPAAAPRTPAPTAAPVPAPATQPPAAERPSFGDERKTIPERGRRTRDALQ